MKGLSNLMEETVLHKIDQIWQETDYCKCDKCKMDIAAYALNLMQVQCRWMLRLQLLYVKPFRS